MTATPRVTDDSSDRSTDKTDDTASALAKGGQVGSAKTLATPEEKPGEPQAGTKDTAKTATNGNDADKRPPQRRSLNVKEIPPFEWKLVGKSRGAFLTLFKAVSREDVEAQLERVRHDGYYTEISILALDEPIKQPRPTFGRRRGGSAASPSKVLMSAPSETPQATVIRLKSRKPDGEASPKKASTAKRKAKAATATKSKAKAAPKAKKKTKRAAAKESASTSTVKAKKTTKRKAAKSSAAKVAKKKTKRAAAKPVARRASRKKA